MTQTSAIKPAPPRHVAIIMDGNGRWARSRGLDRSEGHVAGVNTVRKITEAASEAGVEYLTLYTFSTENWNRPQAEVDALMNLIAIAIERETPDLIRNNVKLSMIGEIDRMPREVVDRLNKCIEETSGSTGLNLVLALSYSARWEITNAARKIAREVAAGKLSPDQINDSVFASYLSTASMPDPDLIIRTGGNMRLSNFLLWQAAYSEIAVVDDYWPDFSKSRFLQLLEDFSGRERRFGLTSQQINSLSDNQ